jgi:hypothetical protein
MRGGNIHKTKLVIAGLDPTIAEAYTPSGCNLNQQVKDMFAVPFRIPVSLAIFIAISGCGRQNSESPPVAVSRSVEQAIIGLDALRSGLAKTITAGDSVDAGTFAQVCKPVGMQAKAISQENGWIVKQIALKYRNPNNQADAEAAGIFPRFEASSGLDSLWIRTEHDRTPGWRYFRRIEVERSCLACHGAKDSRPGFVREKYPDDRAFDFEEGDLRGLYSVFVEDNGSTKY